MKYGRMDLSLRTNCQNCRSMPKIAGIGSPSKNRREMPFSISAIFAILGYEPAVSNRGPFCFGFFSFRSRASRRTSKHTSRACIAGRKCDGLTLYWYGFRDCGDEVWKHAVNQGRDLPRIGLRSLPIVVESIRSIAVFCSKLSW